MFSSFYKFKYNPNGNDVGVACCFCLFFFSFQKLDSIQLAKRTSCLLRDVIWRLGKSYFNLSDIHEVWQRFMTTR